ncbi:hypothetical protein MMC30_002247 [Trapelia coarctata]|nr:hypothetical protein [Trapelia coarctata]
MRTSIALAAAFAAVAFAAPAVSEFTDGQPQVVTTTTTSPYTNPFTSFITQTNSQGVITGMPSVVTSQPSVITSQPAAVTTQPAVVTSPAGAPAPSVATPHFSSVVGSNTTVTTSSPKTSGTGSSTPSGTASAAAGATTTAASGATSVVKPALGLGLVGALFAALL